MIAQLVKRLLVFRGTRRFITIFIRGCQLTASDRVVVQFSHIRPVSLKNLLQQYPPPSQHIFLPKFCICRLSRPPSTVRMGQVVAPEGRDPLTSAQLFQSTLRRGFAGMRMPQRNTFRCVLLFVLIIS